MEGPSLVILKEELARFLNKKVIKVSGNTKQPKENLKGKTLKAIQTWGKMLFLIFSSDTEEIVTKTHFMLFGSYRIDDPKENRQPRLELKFKNGTVYFYACAFYMDAKSLLASLDPQIDLMSPRWDVKKVLKLMKKNAKQNLCDLFLDQTVFAGSGNIIKNEVLFNLRRHPLVKLSDINPKHWAAVATAVRKYCFNFYEWKKLYQLRAHWQVYRKSYCPVCSTKVKREVTGERKRFSFYCPRCQKKTRLKTLKVFDVVPLMVSPLREKRLDH